MSATGIRHAVERIVAVISGLVALLLLIVTMLWRDRVDIDDIELPLAPAADARGDDVQVTWFGVTTLLFDDGETQILIDGFISRPGLFDVLLQRPVDSDAARINYFLDEYDVRRLAAIIPVHSHYDHAMDIGAVANRTSASVLGSPSTASIARGDKVPEDQIIVAEDNETYHFGQFEVSLIPVPHAPIGPRGEVPLAGTIDSPLELPAPVTAFRHGGNYAVLLSHPGGDTLVIGSAGIAAEALQPLSVDLVLLGTGMLESMGRNYIDDYWKASVTSTGAKTVVPIHFDDYTRPFGEIVLAPKVLDDFSVTVRLLRELQRGWDKGTQIYMPVFGVPMPILGQRDQQSET